jgi:hypothetical protein
VPQAYRLEVLAPLPHQDRVPGVFGCGDVRLRVRPVRLQKDGVYWMTEDEELEWAARQYEVATEYLMDVLSKHEEIPNSIAFPLMELADAINAEWEQFE